MINLTKSIHANDKCLIQMLYEMSKCHITVHIYVKCFSCMLKVTVSMLLTGSTKIRAQCGDTKSPSHFVSGSWQDGLLSGQKCQAKPS